MSSTNFPKVITKPARLRLKLADPNFRSKLSSPVVIKGKDFTFYHRLNQVYDKHNPMKLISGAWHKSIKNGEHFSIMPYKPNKATPRKYAKFHDLGLSERIIKSLENNSFKHPTEIQAMSFSPISNHDKHTALFAATGSGKTLAYLLPIMQELEGSGRSLEPRHPLCIILVPTNELCNQVSDLCIKFSDVFQSAHIHSGMTPLETTRLKNEVVQVVIGTPQGIIFALSKGLMKLTKCKFSVIDECDSLLDNSFYPFVKQILPKLIISDHSDSTFCQILFCGATLPKNLNSIFESYTGSDSKQLQVVQGSAVEFVIGHIKHDFYRLGPEKALIHLRLMLSELVRKPGSILIFCSSQTSVRKLSYFMKNEGFTHEAVYGDVDKHYRKNVMSLLRDGFVKILISTDVISRGFDTSNVSFVINYDCPTYLSDYVHRAGRVGRVGQKSGGGRVITFVTRPYQAQVVREIERSVRLHRPLMGVDSNIKQQFSDYAEVKRAMEYEMALKSENSARLNNKKPK